MLVGVLSRILKFTLSLCAFALLAACDKAPGDEGGGAYGKAGEGAENAAFSEKAEVRGQAAAGSGKGDVAISGSPRHILAFGDSLFAGYGMAREDSYPAQLQAVLRAKGMDARITNAGVSGDTSAAGAQRLAFTLDNQAQKPELVLLELGGNDLLRSLPAEQTRANFDAMMAELKRRDIAVVLYGMRALPNHGPDYRAAFDAIHPAMADKYGAELVPFFLEPLQDKPELIQDDHIHPTEAGIALLVEATQEQVEEALR